MATQSEIFAAFIHAHIDALEDVAINGALAVVMSVDTIDPRTWIRLAAAGEADILSRAIAGQVTRATIEGIESAALNTATSLSGVQARGRIKKLDTGLRLFGAQGTELQARRTQSLIADRVTTTQGEIQRLIAEVPPRTKADARRLLQRVEEEVLSPIRSAATWREPMNRVVMDGATQAMSAADVMLEMPTLNPDAALQRAQDATMMWVAALVKTCPDCLPRHGNADTMANWRRRGMPRSGWSVCRGYCRCQLLPMFGGGGIDVPSHTKLNGPLQREKMALVKDGSPRGMTVRVPTELLTEDGATLRSKAERRAALQEAYADDIRVRRAMRLLGSVNQE